MNGNLVATLKKKLADATSTVHDEIAGLRVRILELRKQIERLEADRITRDDARAKIRAVVDRDRERWLREHANGLIYAEDALLKPSTPATSVALPGVRGNLNVPDGSALMSWGAFCVADPARAAAHLDALVGGCSYDSGLPMADRPALIERLTDELQELETADEDMVDAAAAAGVVIEHRPEVQQRRTDEANRRRHEAERIAALQVRHQALDVVPPGRVHPSQHGAHSSYLEEHSTKRFIDDLASGT